MATQLYDMSHTVVYGVVCYACGSPTITVYPTGTGFRGHCASCGADWGGCPAPVVTKTKRRRRQKTA